MFLQSASNEVNTTIDNFDRLFYNNVKKKNLFFGSESFMSEQEKRKHRVCFTGHRPEKLSMSEGKVKSALLQEIMKSINDGYNVFISGMIIDFIIEDLMLNSYLQKNFHTLIFDVS